MYILSLRIQRPPRTIHRWECIKENRFRKCFLSQANETKHVILFAVVSRKQTLAIDQW